MDIGKPFVIRVKPTEEVIRLLESVTLGSNGAKYRHLDTRDKIKQLFRPLFLSLERNNRTLGNITFSRRPCGWYVRYFAFDTAMQGVNSKKNGSSKNNFLKKELNTFFSNALNTKIPDTPSVFYAYIDPKNVKSVWMSEQFGFKSLAKIATQTFSRIKPRKQNQVKKLKDINQIKSLVEKHFKNHQFYFSHHTFNTSPFFGYYDDNDKLIAFFKSQKANWSIERLAGKSGKLLTHAIPFIPGIRKIINPKNHTFSTAETVWVDEKTKPVDRTKILEQLFEGALYEEGTNSLIWWVDHKDQLYKQIKEKLNWGLMHKVNGVNDVDLVALTKESVKFQQETPYFTTALDFI